MLEKIVNFIEESVKISLVIGSLGSLITYLAHKLHKRNRDPEKKFDFNVLEAIIHVFIGATIAYFVSTALPIGYPHRDMVLGASGALAYPVYVFFEKAGIDLLKDAFTAVIDVFIRRGK